MAAGSSSNAPSVSTCSRAHFPWHWRLSGRTVVIELPALYRVLGWAPMGGGLSRARAILNHQIALDDRASSESPGSCLAQVARSLGFRPAEAVAMMTGADVELGACASKRRQGLSVSAWCTAGCSNALRVGDRATARRAGAGTINLAVAINQPVTVAVLAEALQLAVEARVLAVQQTGLTSVRSGLPATGTGTDCIVIAAPESSVDEGGGIAYAGKHTELGEMIGCAVLKSCTIALNRRSH
jgi:adenosylcobinamide amidohydrolase